MDAACGVLVRSLRLKWAAPFVHGCVLGACSLTGCTAEVTGIHDDDWGTIILLIAAVSVLVGLLAYFGPRNSDGGSSADGYDFWGGGDGDGGDGDGGD